MLPMKTIGGKENVENATVSKICQHLTAVKKNSTYLLIDYTGSNSGLFLIRKTTQKNL